MKKVFKYATGAEIPEGAVYLHTVVEDERQYKDPRSICIDPVRLVWHYFLVDDGKHEEMCVCPECFGHVEGCTCENCLKKSAICTQCNQEVCVDDCPMKLQREHGMHCCCPECKR